MRRRAHRRRGQLATPVFDQEEARRLVVDEPFGMRPQALGDADEEAVVGFGLDEEGEGTLEEGSGVGWLGDVHGSDSGSGWTRAKPHRRYATVARPVSPKADRP